MARQQPTRLVVGAIDFGTTFSGFAFSTNHDYKRDPAYIATQHWYGTSGLVSEKAPTCVLFDKAKKFHSFGFEAEDHYAELAMDGHHKDWYFFRNFKMALHERMTFPRDFELHEENGKVLPAIEVFSAAIKFLKDGLYQKCKEGLRDITDNDFVYVLTVPAIWNDAAKQFMRDAAEMAGIPSDTLLICLEPEAASIYCKVTQKKVAGGDDRKSLFQAGSKYLVVDAGGGTVDTTVHEVEEDGGLKELTRASGGDWGGSQVDRAFFTFLAEVFGEAAMDDLKENHMDSFIDLRRAFESKKRGKPSKVAITLPVLRHYPSSNDISSRFGKSFSFRSNKIFIPEFAYTGFFKEARGKIVQHVQSLLKQGDLRDVKTILLVGGFSDSPYLKNAIRGVFEKPGHQVIVPIDAGLAVLKGAVIFGHNPMIIKQRMCRYTYGISSGMTFRPGIDPESQKYTDDAGEVRCDYRFDVHVTVGQQVKTGEPQTSSNYLPRKRTQSEILFPVYASTEKDPVYVTDASCTKLGEITVDVSDVPLAEDEPLTKRSVDVQLTFGGTELKVDAKLERTGKLLTATMNYHVGE